MNLQQYQKAMRLGLDGDYDAADDAMQYAMQAGKHDAARALAQKLMKAALGNTKHGRFIVPPNEGAFRAVIGYVLAMKEPDPLRKLLNPALPFRKKNPELYQILLDWLEPVVRSTLAEAAAYAKTIEVPTVVDLCCGAGMASLGFEESGFQAVLGIDVWDSAVRSFEANHPGAFGLEVGVQELYDLVTERGVELFDVDVVTTGPPCQDDSRMVKNRVDACSLGRGELKFPTIEVAEAFNPSYIVMETVNEDYGEELFKEGATQMLRLVDSDHGGSTQRKRYFYIWAPDGIELDVSNLRAPFVPWDVALRQIGYNVPDGSCLTNDNTATHKRWKQARRPGQFAHATTGQGSAYLLRTPRSDQASFDCEADVDWIRLPPEHAAALSHYPNLALLDSTVRGRSTLLGNGWPKSFGRVIGAAIAAAETAS